MSFEKEREYPLSTTEFQTRAPVRAVDWRVLNNQQHYMFEKSGFKVTPLVWPHYFSMDDNNFIDPPGSGYNDLENIVKNQNDHGPDLDEVSVLVKKGDLKTLSEDYKVTFSVRGQNVVIVVGIFSDDTLLDEVNVVLPQQVEDVESTSYILSESMFDQNSTGTLEFRLRGFVLQPREDPPYRFKWFAMHASPVDIELDLTD